VDGKLPWGEHYHLCTLAVHSGIVSEISALFTTLWNQ
jgi:hypothetical protein